MLLNSPVVSFNPETILLKKEEISDSICLILTGDVEMIQSESGVYNIISSGGFIGEMSGLTGTPSMETYRAKNFVQALQIPRSLYLEFVKHNGLYEEIVSLQENRVFLQNTWLLGESISYAIQIDLCKSFDVKTYKADEIISMEDPNRISIVKEGKLEIYLNDDVIEVLTIGDFFGEDGVLHGTTPLHYIRPDGPSVPNQAVTSPGSLKTWKLTGATESNPAIILPRPKARSLLTRKAALAGGSSGRRTFWTRASSFRCSVEKPAMTASLTSQTTLWRPVSS